VTPERATPSDYPAIRAALPRFWDDRDLRGLHHPMFVHEFGAGPGEPRVVLTRSLSG
jgi:hypothetical protein